jgi:small subunit ribosomal protein S1
MSEFLHEESDSERLRRREELINSLKPGEIRKGVVSHLANFGAFVDLGGAEGLVHISQMTWGSIIHPGEVLYVGQEVEVRVLSVDKEKKKIALSIKRAGDDPWASAEQRYVAGQIVTGVVARVVPFGAFARIEDGIEGLISLSELASLVDPKTILYEGAQLPLCIVHIDAERRRLRLGLLQGSAMLEIACPECGRAISPDWKYCTYCRASLAGTCPKCGAPRPNIEGVRFCFECGNAFE